MSLALSVSMPILFIASSPLIFRQVNIEYLLLILISVKIAIVGLSSPFNWIASGLKPDILAFAYIVFESFKLFSAYILVAVMRLGLAGIILAVSIGYISKTMLLYVSLRWFITGSMNTRIVKRILRGLWIPIYGSIPSIISSLDAIILVGITGLTDSLAFISAIRTVGSPISLSLAISTALYPKLLAEGRLEDVEEAMRLVYMLSIPSSIGVILLAPHILSILRYEYTIVSTPLAIYAILQLISIASHLAVTTASGLEQVDLNEYAMFKDYARSRLFKIANMHMISSLMYVGVLTSLLYYHRSRSISDMNPLLSTTWIWIISVTVSMIFSLVYAYRRLLKGVGQIKAPWPSLAKYTLASIIMTIPVYMLQPRAIHVEILPLLIGITPPILSGVTVYLAILYLIDPWFRDLVSKLISTITEKIISL